MIDLYIHKKESNYIIKAKKRENENKRSCHDETVFSFCIKNKDKSEILKNVYNSLILYTKSELIKNKEEINIRILDKELFDAFRKSRKSLGKMRDSFTSNNDYENWKNTFEVKSNLIKILMKNKSMLNMIYDTLEDNKTLEVIKQIENIDISLLSKYPDIDKQLKINEDMKSLMKECVLREIKVDIEETIRTERLITDLVIYSDGGISIKGNIETGHSYGSVIFDLSDKNNEKCFIKLKGKIDLLKYIDTKHNVDFMELYAAYRSLKIINEKIKVKEIPEGVNVVIRMDNKSNIDIFKGLKKNSSPINKVLWDEIEVFSNVMKIDMEWVKGHDKDINNNLADELVNEGRKMEQEGEVIILNTEVRPLKRKI